MGGMTALSGWAMTKATAVNGSSRAITECVLAGTFDVPIWTLNSDAVELNNNLPAFNSVAAAISAL